MRRSAVFLAVAALLAPAALAADPAPERFVIPAEMAPVRLDRAFPLRVATTSGETAGTATLALGASGSLTGTLDLDGATLTVTGRQKFIGARGTVRIDATGDGGGLRLDGKLRGTSISGKARGTGAFASARTFALDVLVAEPLRAVLVLDVTTDARGRATASGEALVSGDSVAVSGRGTRGRSFSLALNGASFTARVKGKAFAAGGYVGSVQTTGYGARGTAKDVRAAPIPVDLAAGAFRSPGAAPAIVPVTYQDIGGPATVDAHAGRVVLLVDPATSASDASALVSQNGGAVVGAVPAIGLHVVSIAAGQVPAFIGAVRPDARVRVATPDVALTRGSAEVFVIDDCGGTHGDGVVGAFRDEGGTGVTCLSDFSPEFGAVPRIEDTLAQIAEAVRLAGSNEVLLNISTYGQSADEWRKIVELYLGAIAALTPEQRDRLVLTVCAGNEGMDQSAELTKLRANVRWAEVLDENVLIVGAVPAAANSNSAPGDPAFVYMPRCDSPATTGCGTSYSAPRALAVVQKLMREKKLPARLALRAAKAAAGAQEDQVLLTSEALDVAEAYRTSRASIDAEPASFTFTATEGGAAPAPQTLTVTNSGAAVSTLRFGATEDAPWLDLDGDTLPLDAGESAEFTLTVDPTNLRPGRTSTFVLLRDDRALKPVVRVPVVVDVAPAPAASISIGEASLTFVRAGGNYREYLLTASGTVTGPVGSTLFLYLDTDAAPQEKRTDTSAWGSSEGPTAYRHEGEPKSSTWSFTARVIGDDSTPTTITLEATVHYFGKQGFVEFVATTDLTQF